MKTLIEKYNILKILLVEDDEDDQFIFSEAIKKLPLTIELIIINDGRGVFEKFKTDNLIPHLIFLDLNMPKMNGVECLKEIKKNNILKDIPCIILTTSISLTDIDVTFNCGANLYLQKPYDFDGFVRLFSKVFEINWKDYFPPKRETFFMREQDYF